jgi:23S rRNA (uracil1939-C5)-methyltransferase
MVTIYKSKAKVQKGPQHLELTIDRWDQEAQSIAFSDGKICFVEGALPGEKVKVKVTEQKAQYLKAEVQKVLIASEHRIAPLCRFAAECGGCQLHHVPHSETTGTGPTAEASAETGQPAVAAVITWRARWV